MVIRNGKPAVKTLDVTYVSIPEKPIYKSINQLRVGWAHNSTSLIAEGSTLTIQWSPAQLSDWAPRTIPNDVAQSYGFGRPTVTGPAVYTLKGNELTRINDPNPVTYRRIK
jgi:hypothetical protein